MYQPIFRLFFFFVILCMLYYVSWAQEFDLDADQQEVLENNGNNIDSMNNAGDIKENDFSYWHGFSASFSVILVSEIGDKTFFIAAILAMRHSRFIVLIGAFGALALMTALSAAMGFLFTIIPRIYTFYISTLLLIFFGLKLIKEGLEMTDEEGLEELEEVQQEINQKEREIEESGRNSRDVEEARPANEDMSSQERWMRDINNGILLQAFIMTFVAEWGDRSQITTVILAARENPYAVTVGGSLGHFICTTCAVIGGRLLAQRISVKAVTILGGVVFLFFAASSLIFGMDD